MIIQALDRAYTVTDLTDIFLYLNARKGKFRTAFITPNIVELFCSQGFQR